MLTEFYIEALLVDEDLADQVWGAWDAGEIDDATVFLMWLIVAQSPPDKAYRNAVKPISDIGPRVASERYNDIKVELVRRGIPLQDY